jgi:hypothetical protein
VSERDEERRAKRDYFQLGVISKLFPGNNTGVVRTETGREIPFSFQLVTMVGETKQPNDLREGQEVGYDVGWTSAGLKVIKIKTYPAGSIPRRTKALEREGGESDDLPREDLADEDAQ